MMKLFSSKNNANHGIRGQAIVEFAIVLPILLVILVGILEVGRMILIYSALNNASRNAVRYASVVGKDDSGNYKYSYCDGIKNTAIKSAFLMRPVDLVVTISYDHGPSTGSYDTCDGSVDTGVEVSTGDRVLVTVTAQYRPMVKLIPFPNRTFTSSSFRTILGIVELE